jgi:esterase/lipase superfamily enzyme
LSNVKLNISELVMTAPDIDRDVFSREVERIREVAAKITMCASAADKALLASDKKAWGTCLGYIDAKGPNLFDGIETIDVTAVGDDMLGLNHSTFSASSAVLNDIGRLIVSGTHPPGVPTPILRNMPDRKNTKYWMYPQRTRAPLNKSRSGLVG